MKRGRNMLEMILSPISDDDLIKDFERLKFEVKKNIYKFSSFYVFFVILLRLAMTQPASFGPVPQAALEPINDSVKPESELQSMNDIEHEPPVGLSMPLSPSIEYLDDDESDEEDEDDKFNNDLAAAPSMPLRPPPTSISTIRLSQENRSR